MDCFILVLPTAFRSLVSSKNPLPCGRPSFYLFSSCFCEAPASWFFFLVLAATAWPSRYVTPSGSAGCSPHLCEGRGNGFSKFSWCRLAPFLLPLGFLQGQHPSPIEYILESFSTSDSRSVGHHRSFARQHSPWFPFLGVPPIPPF